MLKNAIKNSVILSKIFLVEKFEDYASDIWQNSLSCKKLKNLKAILITSFDKSRFGAITNIHHTHFFPQSVFKGSYFLNKVKKMSTRTYENISGLYQDSAFSTIKPNLTSLPTDKLLSYIGLIFIYSSLINILISYILRPGLTIVDYKLKIMACITGIFILINHNILNIVFLNSRIYKWWIKK